jgi:protein-arginine kinase activator protein McsA
MQGKLIPNYTREMVITTAKKFFPNEDLKTILAILDLYGDDLREKHRVHVAALNLSEEKIEKLRENIAAARFDFRDIILAAEYDQAFLMRDPTIPHLKKSEE